MPLSPPFLIYVDRYLICQRCYWLAIVELDKKIKVEKLLAVHPVKSAEEIDELISEANRTIFSTGH